MGDRYDIDVKCAYCKHINEDMWYAPTSNCDFFRCEKCKGMNFITAEFEAKKLTDTNVNDVRSGFCNATNASWSDEEIERMCKEHLKEIKEMNK